MVVDLAEADFDPETLAEWGVPGQWEQRSEIEEERSREFFVNRYDNKRDHYALGYGMPMWKLLKALYNPRPRFTYGDRLRFTHRCPPRMSFWKEFVIDDNAEMTVSFPMHNEVCDLCRGNGAHTNASIDASGITDEDWDRDPGFYEDYTRGAFQQTCNQCNGKNVVPTIDRQNLSDMQLKLLAYADESDQDDYNDYRTRCAEDGIRW